MISTEDWKFQLIFSICQNPTVGIHATERVNLLSRKKIELAIKSKGKQEKKAALYELLLKNVAQIHHQQATQSFLALILGKQPIPSFLMDLHLLSPCPGKAVVVSHDFNHRTR